MRNDLRNALEACDAPPSPPAAIDYQFDLLLEELTRMEAIINHLSDRTKGVRCSYPQLDKDNIKSEEPMMSPLAGRLRCTRETVSTFNERLDQLISEIEL